MTQEPITEAVGSNVRAEMARRGVTQEQVAALLGISQPQVSKRLAGSLAFDVVELEKLSGFLGVPLTRFLPAAPASSGTAA